MQSKKMKKLAISAVAVAALTTLVVGGTVTASYAADFGDEGSTGGEIPVGSATHWDIPHEAMTNVVTIGDRDYKVITTQTASNWVTAGPDWMGISNSAQLTSSNVTDLESAQTNSMIGIWASAANQVPNAYNWNYFYNLYANSADGQAEGAAVADLAIQGNGTALDTTSGVAGGLKYRPEILWTDSYSSVATYVEYIQEGKYFAESYSDDPATNTSKYAAPHDSEYDPQEIGFSQGNDYNNGLALSKMFYKMAYACENVETATETYDGKDLDGNEVNAENATWLTMNALPRTTRYEASDENPMSARQCALALEKVEKGAIWYALSQIYEGKIEKKKVAFVTTQPTEGWNVAYVAAFDAYDSYSPSSSSAYGNNNGGFAGISGMAFDQLTSETGQKVSNGDFGGYSFNGPVTCDDLANCDCVIATGIGGTNQSYKGSITTFRDWVVDGCTTSANKSKAQNDVSYAVFAPPQCNPKNFSVDKSIYGIYCMDFVYPELFPNMELLSYWYNCIYHIKSDCLVDAMQWTLANSSLPDNCSLSAVPDTYSIEDLDAKFNAGYWFYTNYGYDDDTLSLLQANKGIITGEDLGEFDLLDDNGQQQYDGDGKELKGKWADVLLTPSNTYKEFAEGMGAVTFKKATKSGGTTTPKKSSAKKQTIKAKKKLTAKVGKKATVKVKKAKTKLAFKANKKTKKALKIKVKGKKKVLITATKKAQKGKTYTVKVYAKKSGSYAKSNVVKIKVKVK